MAEAVGTAFLVVAVVGSGITAERLAGGETAVALLASSLATGAGLFALIVWLAPISGAHLNPVITLALVVRREMPVRLGLAYAVAQVAGAVLGVVLAHAMFDMRLISLATKERSGTSQVLSEMVSTFGLLAMVLTFRRTRQGTTASAAAVAAFVAGGFWFTATGFANPAAAAARALTDTFAGIRPRDVPGFLVGETAGWLLALVACRGTRGSSATSSRAARPEPALRELHR
jgi:glycerol uptake facilitator-like aquaporin